MPWLLATGPGMAPWKKDCRIFSTTQSYKKNKNHMKIKQTKLKFNNNKSGRKKKKITSLILRP